MLAERYVGPTRAARLLGVTPQRVRQLCAAGLIAYERTDLGRLIELRSLEALAERRRLRTVAGEPPVAA